MDHYDPTDIQALEDANGAQSERAKVQAQIETEDLKWLMSDKRGRRIVWRFLSDAGVYRSSFATNALQMAYREGERSFGLSLLAKIVNIPARYAEMIAEHNR